MKQDEHEDEQTWNGPPTSDTKGDTGMPRAVQKGPPRKGKVASNKPRGSVQYMFITFSLKRGQHWNK